MKLWNLIREWWTRWKIRWSVHRFCKEGQGGKQAAEPAEEPKEADVGEQPSPSWPEISTVANHQVVGRCEIGFRVTPQILRDIDRFFKRRRQARRCLYLARHGKNARIRKKNAKRAEALSGPLVIHIPRPHQVGHMTWWWRRPLCSTIEEYSVGGVPCMLPCGVASNRRLP